MRVILGEKGSGKTTKLIEIAAKFGAYIVVRDYRKADEVFKIAKDMGYSIPYPISFFDFIHKKFNGCGISAFVIDDVDSLLQYVAGCVPVLAFSVTTGEEGNENRVIRSF